MQEVVEDFKGGFLTIEDLKLFGKTSKWDKWTDDHNIPPGIIGRVEDIFKKMEEMEKEQKRNQETKKEQKGW